MVVLIMTDPSAAFDTIDHSLLLQRLNCTFGINGGALEWICSNLTGRSQRVVIGNSASRECQLDFGVPQGSVLSPKMYCMYTRPVGTLQYTMGYNITATLTTQADDVLVLPSQWSALATKIKDCVRELQEWMGTNQLTC